MPNRPPTPQAALSRNHTGIITTRPDRMFDTDLRCIDCRQTKPRTEFTDNKAMQRGHGSYCKQCTHARIRIHRGVHIDDAYLRPAADQRCEICSSAGGKRGMFFDHDHTTGRFRGWLCSRCNTAIGQLRDDADLVAKALAYLQRGRP